MLRSQICKRQRRISVSKQLKTLQVYAEKYAADQVAFFKDYAEAHAKLSNLGAKFDPPQVCYYEYHEHSSFDNRFLFYLNSIVQREFIF